MDEVSPTSQTVVMGKSTIEKELDEGALQILRNARKELVYPAATAYEEGTLIRSNTTGTVSAIIPLTDDFIRFLRVKLAAHDVAIDELVSVDSNVYRSQGNQYQRATTDKPIAALIPFKWSQTQQLDNKYGEPMVPQVFIGPFTSAIEVFPAPSSTSTLQVINVQTFDKSATGMAFYKNVGIAAGKQPVVSECLILSKIPAEQMPQLLVDPLVWLAAGRCLSSLREYDAAKVAYANFAQVMSEIRVGQIGESVPVKGAK